MFYKRWQIKIRLCTFATRNTFSYNKIIIIKITCSCSVVCLTNEQGPLQNLLSVRVS